MVCCIRFFSRHQIVHRRRCKERETQQPSSFQQNIFMTSGAMVDLEKAESQDPQSSLSLSSSEALSRTHTGGDLSKAETAADRLYAPITTSASNARSVARSALSHTRTGASITDGFASYSLVDQPEDTIEDVLAARRTPSDAYEVRWDGKSDPLSPRNMSAPRKWLVTMILSSSAFLV